MEPLTHTLVGATLARTPLARNTPRAALTLMVAANLPDLDVLSFIAGGDASLGFRRGWTHGPLALVILPPIWTLIVLALDRRKKPHEPCNPPDRPTRLLALAYLGCLTHPLLDWLNTYGVRLLMPFDERWFYGDAVFIVDPWLWLILGGALYCGAPRKGRVPWGWWVLAGLTTLAVVLARQRLPGVAQGIWFVGLLAIVLVRRYSGLARRPGLLAATALVVSLVYVGTLTTVSRVGSGWVREELGRRGVVGVSRLMVGPRPADPLRWSVVAETSAGYRYGVLRWFPRRLSLASRVIAKPRSSAVVDAALAAPQVRGVLGWMRFPFVEVEETSEGWTVHIMDARYVRMRGEGFGTARVRLDRGLRVVGGGP